MEKKEVIWTLPAKNDLKRSYDYISDVSEIIAEKSIQKILLRTRLLEKGFTKIGQQEPLLKHRKDNYRYLVEGNYKII